MTKGKISFELKNSLSELDTLEQKLRQFANQLGLTEKCYHEINLVLEELFTNIISYGYTDSAEHLITIAISHENGTLVMMIEDDGVPFNPIDAEEVNLEHLTASVGAVFRGDMDSRGLKLETRVGGDSPVVKSHGEALKDILSNLLSNAIEASPEGGTVRIEFSHNERQLVLTVADEGPGIPQEIRHRVGDSFFTTKSKGTGLGLAIVKRRSEQLGGQLSILNPAFGKGTRIMVAIPLTESHNTS